MEARSRLLQPYGGIVTIRQTLPSVRRDGLRPSTKSAFPADATAPLQPPEFSQTRRDLFVLNRGRRNVTYARSTSPTVAGRIYLTGENEIFFCPSVDLPAMRADQFVTLNFCGAAHNSFQIVCPLKVNFAVVRYLIDRSSAWTSETIGQVESSTIATKRSASSIKWRCASVRKKSQLTFRKVKGSELLWRLSSVSADFDRQPVMGRRWSSVGRVSFRI